MTLKASFPESSINSLVDAIVLDRIQEAGRGGVAFWQLSVRVAGSSKGKRARAVSGPIRSSLSRLTKAGEIGFQQEGGVVPRLRYVATGA